MTVRSIPKAVWRLLAAFATFSVGAIVVASIALRRAGRAIHAPVEIGLKKVNGGYALSHNVFFSLDNPPNWVCRCLPKVFKRQDGVLLITTLISGGWTVILAVNAGFVFDVSFAPSFPKALPAACVHDWICGHADDIATTCGVPVSDVLCAADRWFLAQMGADGFRLARTYYIGVRMFGRLWHTLFTRRAKTLHDQ